MIDLNDNEINTVLAGLGKLPLEQSGAVFAKIQQWRQQQKQPAMQNAKPPAMQGMASANNTAAASNVTTNTNNTVPKVPNPVSRFFPKAK